MFMSERAAGRAIVAHTRTCAQHRPSCLSNRESDRMASDNRRPVFFLHMSTAGGTSVCRWAQDQPCARVPACGANCNLHCRHPWDWRSHCPGQPACSRPAKLCKTPFATGACDALAQYVRRKNLTFMASETMLFERCFQRFHYVTILRDPVERLRSLLERRRGAQDPNMRLSRLLSRLFAFNTSEPSSLMGTPALDNYLTRLLLGPPVFFLPLGGVNASHFRAAARVLAKFAVAIPIDNLTTSGVRWLAHAIGYRGVPVRSNLHSKHRATTASGRLGALSERHLRLLRSLNRYDTQLVALASARYTLQRARAGTARGDVGSSSSSPMQTLRLLPHPRLEACQEREAEGSTRQCPAGKVAYVGTEWN